MPNRTNHLGLKRHTNELAAVLKHAAPSRFEQICKSLAIHRLVQKKGGAAAKGLLHGFGVVLSSNYDDWGRFVPGGGSNVVDELETIHLWHLKIHKDAIESLPVDQNCSFGT